MDPTTLRTEILRLVSEHDAKAGFIDDKVVASALGVPLIEVQRQLDVLEYKGLVKLYKTFGPNYSASLTPAGILALEG